LGVRHGRDTNIGKNFDHPPYPVAERRRGRVFFSSTRRPEFTLRRRRPPGHEENQRVRFVVFADGQGRRPGVLSGTMVEPFGPDIESLEAFIALDPAARRSALAARGPATALAQVELLAPLAPRKNVFCVGRNYLAHAQEGARARGEQLDLPSVPTFFTKAPTAVAGPGATLHLSAGHSAQYDWEAELAVIIGMRCKDVAEDAALDVIFGYTCLNDVTARDLQRAHQQWFKGKSLDDTCPLGPWIVDRAELPDPQHLDIALRVNGVTHQHSNTSAMIFSIRRIIAELSKGMTLEPGDVIATGTPDGVGFAMDPPLFLADGDVMEVEIEAVGMLRNPVSIVAPVGAAR
jgi:2-keto-4-pentenoate hydratase/2-oxohepta-3-ene-1,7-dioic acid hydratase in catechol pathway